MNLSKYIALFITFSLAGCQSMDVDKIAEEYCSCRTVEQTQGGLQGENCLKEWDKKYGSQKFTETEAKRFQEITLECNKIAKENSFIHQSLEKQYSIEDMAGLFCDCRALQAEFGDTIATACFVEFDTQYGTIELSEAESNEFQSMIDTCSLVIPFPDSLFNESYLDSL